MKESKKIMHMMSTDAFSGAENVVCQIINIFNNNINYDLEYCSVIKKNQEQLKLRNIPILKLDNFSIKSIRKAIKEYNPDIIHAHDPKATIAAILARPKCKIIAHIHSNHRYMRKINIKSVFFHSLIKNKVSSIIWVSESAKNEYVFANKIPKRITSVTIQNIVDGDQLKVIAKTDKKSYNFDIIFLGRLEDVKDPLRFVRLIKQIKKFRDIKVAMVGDGTMRNEVEQEIHKYSLDKNIMMFGNQINPYKILLNSKLLLITSKYEGMPMNALEAIACNIPVVSTPVDGLLEIIDRKYLCTSDKDFVKVIIDLLGNQEKVNKYKEELKVINSTINNIENYKTNIEKLYN